MGLQLPVRLLAGKSLVACVDIRFCKPAHRTEHAQPWGARPGSARAVSATFRTRTWQRHRFPHHLPGRFGGVRAQCRAGCPYAVHKFRCGKAARFISDVIENCPIGDLSHTRSSSLHRTGVFVARLITHANFQKHHDDQRQPGKCGDDHRRYNFTSAGGAIQLTNAIQERFALQQDRVDPIPRPRSKQS